MRRLKNHLSKETSTYLKEHADNPVDWYPWCDEALLLAKKENKPILLSIGYSSCHWCHVMADESFTDEETAQIMNDNFINIKVDREERPDLDKIYQLAHQLLVQRGGGWPLTVFLDPHDQMPFFAGTYFPQQSEYGTPSFKECLLHIIDFYQNDYDQLQKQSRRFVEALYFLTPSADEIPILHDGPLVDAIDNITLQFDPQFGGFSAAPKFPHTDYCERLLQHWWQKEGDAKKDHLALAMVNLTLTQMARGGIYDQLGGGFFRYTIDSHWLIPHFEKMLYDNALLLHTYSDAYLISAKPLFAQVLTETAYWVVDHMQDPSGAYYTSVDADTDGEEGKYYCWDEKELRQSLSANEFQVIADYYGLGDITNFRGKWHFSIHDECENIA